MKKSVKGKLGLGFGLILALVCALGVYSVITISGASATTDRLYTKNLRGLRDIAMVDSLIAGMRSDITEEMLGQKSEGIDTFVKNLGARREAIEKRWSEYYPAKLTTDEERAAADSMWSEYQAVTDKLDQFIAELKSTGVYGGGIFYTEQVQPSFIKLSFQLMQLEDYQVKRAGIFHAQSMQATQRDQVIVVAVIVAALLMTLVITWLLTRMISRPLASARRLAESIADGRLDNQVHIDRGDEFGVMLRALGAMQNRLAEMVEKVRAGSDAVSVGASQIASGNDELSTRTQEQAANLEETAASMEQMTSTVRQNADNAAQADQLARGVRAQAEEGGQVVGRAVESMEKIDAASRRISDIIGLIDDIAFQTNLLALNASVEAARAGEQGRGFAVVASEVRNLASRSAAAAKDIKGLVEDSAAKVKDGSEQVSQSGKTLEEIVENINKVSDIVAEIAAASKEQSSGIEQVNLAVSEMDSMTQQNASLVEESAAASRSLEEQAHALKAQVAFFKAGDEAAADVAEHHDTPKPAPAVPAFVDAAPAAASPRATVAMNVASDGEWASF
ncbi:methyl-accepting chemotaxis protein [Salinisphaera aquimarina]|uniref:Methyl-accepting chemotaxis protein n=1 Tax=Salinisphaera aquimarina TaxID=2094031 RepID=A0ABV7ERS9_9GAMM